MPKQIIRIISLLLLPLLLCDGPCALALSSTLAPSRARLQVSLPHSPTPFDVEALVAANLWFNLLTIDLKVMSRLRKAGRTLRELSGLDRFPWRIVIAPPVDGGPPLIGIVRMDDVDPGNSQLPPQGDGPDRFTQDYPEFSRRIGERWIEDHWPQIDAMCTSAGSGAAFLFEFGWPRLMDAYDRPGWAEGHWEDLVAMTLASGEEAGALLGFGLPALKTQFKLLGVNMHWTEWKRIIIGSKTEAWRVLTYSIPKVRATYPGSWFAQNIELLAGMVEREREGTPWLLERAFTANQDIITERGLRAFSEVWTPRPEPEKKSPRLAKDVIARQFGILWYYHHYVELSALAAESKEPEIRRGLGLAALADNHRSDFIKARWAELYALGMQAGSDAAVLFESLSAIVDYLPEGSWKTVGIPLLGFVRAARTEGADIPAKLTESMASLDRAYQRPWVVQNLPGLLTNSSKAGAGFFGFLGTTLPSLSSIITGENLGALCRTLRRVGADHPAILYRALAVYMPAVRSLITAENLEARSRFALGLYEDTEYRTDGLPDLLAGVSSELTDENLAPVSESLKRLQRGFPKIPGQFTTGKRRDVEVMNENVAQLGAGWMVGQLAGMSRTPDDEIAYQIHVEIPRRIALIGAERLKIEWDRLKALRLSIGVSVTCFDGIIGPKFIDRLGLDWVEAHIDMLRDVDRRQRQFDVDVDQRRYDRMVYKAETIHVWSNLAEVIDLWGVEEFRLQGPDLVQFTQDVHDTAFDGTLSLMKQDPLNVRAIFPSADASMPGLSWPELTAAMQYIFSHTGPSVCQMLNVLMGPAVTIDRDRRLLAKQLIGRRGGHYYTSGALDSELLAEVRSPEIRARWEALRERLREYRENHGRAADFEFEKFIGLLASFSNRALAASEITALSGEIDALQEAGYDADHAKRAIQLAGEHGGGIAFWRNLQSGLLALAAHTNKHNRRRVLQLLLGSGSTEYFYLRQILARHADILRHLAFYAEVLEEYPRLGYGLLEGLTAGISQGQVAMELSMEDRRHVFEFIDYMRSFMPNIYAIYRRDGLSALEPLRDLAGKIRTDEIGAAEIDLFAAHYVKKRVDEEDEEYVEEDSESSEDGEPSPIPVQAVGPLATAIQSVITTSGASFVGAGEVHGLLTTRIRQGDLRHHVPAALRNKDFGPGKDGEIVLNEWTLKPDEKTFDPTGRLNQIINQLRFPDRGVEKAQAQRLREADQKALHEAIRAYIQAKNDETSGQLLAAFFKFVSHFNQLGEKVDHVVLGDYQGTLLLEQLFVDRHNLVEVLVKELETYFTAHSAGRPQVPVTLTTAIRNPGSVAKTLIRVWEQGQKVAANVRDAFKRILHGIGLGVAQEALLPLLPDGDLAALAVSVIQEATPMRPETSEEMAAQLFAEPVRVVGQEKARFHSTESDRKFSLEFRVVKGIPYGLWGLNAGVCIAPDEKLWADPHFMLLAMIDKESGRAAGFVHLYEVNRDGRKILTVPGIEPSVEFLSEVRAQDVYPLIESALIEVAKAGGYDWVFLPADPNILSNRTEISDLVAKRVRDGRYPPATLSSPVQWNTVPEAYPFSTGHLLYQKSGGAPSLAALAAHILLVGTALWSWISGTNAMASTFSAAIQNNIPAIMRRESSPPIVQRAA